jgi:hypothetical protein
MIPSPWTRGSTGTTPVPAMVVPPRHAVRRISLRAQTPVTVPWPGTSVPRVDDLALLELEARTIWGVVDDRLGGGVVCVTALTYDGRTRVLPGTQALQPNSPIATSTCRCWVLPRGSAEADLPAGVRLATGPVAAAPPSGWAGTDWAALVAGERGPYVTAVANERVVSLAHCARRTDTVAEVGVETDADWSGRGLARACVRAWAAAMPSNLTLFYSAMEDNPASHRVALACGARPLGRLLQCGLPASKERHNDDGAHRAHEAEAELGGAPRCADRLP